MNHREIKFAFIPTRGSTVQDPQNRGQDATPDLEILRANMQAENFSFFVKQINVFDNDVFMFFDIVVTSSMCFMDIS